MPNFRLLIEYDGTQFHGWQIQAEGRTVQGELSSALQTILGEEITLIGAGRTDAGVHATGQVANFHTSLSPDPDRLHASLNGVLPPDICIHAVAVAEDSFHSRFSALDRMYRYYCSSRPTALHRSHCWHVGYRLDTDLLQRGAQVVAGAHDFTAFSKSGTDVKDYICRVDRSDWSERDGQLVYEIRADRFVRGMVRALVGTMIDLGRGFIALDEFRSVLESKDRSRAGQLAPPHGLVLEEIRY